jgi:hypothetical protein
VHLLSLLLLLYLRLLLRDLLLLLLRDLLLLPSGGTTYKYEKRLAAMHTSACTQVLA